MAVIEKKEEPTLGALLREAIEKKRIVPAELMRLSGISVRNIEALIRGDLASLPSAVYVEGMLQKLASMLDLDGRELVKRYRARVEYQPKGRRSPSVSGAETALEGRGRPILTPQRSTLIAGVLVLSTLLFYVGWVLQPLFRAPRLLVDSPARDMAVTEPAVTVSGKSDSGSDLTVNGEPTYLDGEGRFRISFFLYAGVNTIEVVAKNRYGNEARVTRYIVYTPDIQK